MGTIPKKKKICFNYVRQNNDINTQQHLMVHAYELQVKQYESASHRNKMVILTVKMMIVVVVISLLNYSLYHS
jgi:hypothetical protein